MSHGFAPVAAGLCLFLTMTGARAATPENLAPGTQQILRFPGVINCVALGDPLVADVKLLSRHNIRLLGLKPGRTNLTVWSGKDAKGHAFAITVGPDTAALQARLAAAPELHQVVARSAPQGVTLTGQVPSLDARQKALALAQSENGKGTDDALAVTGRRMIAVEVRFAAVSADTLKTLGINFRQLGGGFQFASGVPNSISDFSLSPGGLDVTTSLPLAQAFNLLLAAPHTGFMSVISALNSVNLAQILAQPTLLVRSGDDADFLAGGEIPIPVPQSGEANGAIGIEYRKFGVQLHVHAVALSDERIVIRVHPEVSELDYQNALTIQGFNVPAIRTRSTDTTIELGDGQSFVLAGLMYSSASSVEEKIPGLGNLPIIGDLFKRSQHSGERQELIIVATPHLVSPMAPGAVPKLPGEGMAYAPSDGDLLLNTHQLDRFVLQYGLAKP
jgi:pilus assembly protein CpaC